MLGIKKRCRASRPKCVGTTHKPGESPALQLPLLEKLVETEERIVNGVAAFEALDKPGETLHRVRQ
jgi:hypothetical protein